MFLTCVSTECSWYVCLQGVHDFCVYRVFVLAISAVIMLYKIVLLQAHLDGGHVSSLPFDRSVLSRASSPPPHPYQLRRLAPVWTTFQNFFFNRKNLPRALAPSSLVDCFDSLFWLVVLTRSVLYACVYCMQLWLWSVQKKTKKNFQGTNQ